MKANGRKKKAGSKTKVGRSQLTFTKNLISDYLGKSIPLFLDVKITYRCNCRCRFCNLWKRKELNELTLEEHKSLIRQARQMGVRMVSYEGGEPLLRKDLPQILQYANRQDMIVHVNTNGLLLEEKAASIAPHLDEISVSLDYYDKTKHDKQRGIAGLYEKALTGIKKTKDKVPVTISTTITKQTTKQDVIMLSKMCQEHGIGISFQPVYFFDNSEDLTVSTKRNIEMFKLIARLKKDGLPIYNLDSFVNLLSQETSIQCRSGDTCVFIHPDGRLSFPCNQWKGKENFLGSIRHDTLKELWNSQPAEELRKKARKCCSCSFGCTVYLSLATTKASTWMDYLTSYARLLH